MPLRITQVVFVLNGVDDPGLGVDVEAAPGGIETYVIDAERRYDLQTSRGAGRGAERIGHYDRVETRVAGLGIADRQGRVRDARDVGSIQSPLILERGRSHRLSLEDDTGAIRRRLII